MSKQQRASNNRAFGWGRRADAATSRGGVWRVAAAAGVLAMAGGAAATDWIGQANTPLPFEDPANWSGAALPGENDDAFINRGGIAVLSTFNGMVSRLRVGSATGETGRLNQTGGSLATLLNVMVGGDDAGGTGSGTYNISDGSFNAGTDFFIGYTGPGSFDMSGGTIIAGRHMGFAWATGGQATGRQTAGIINTGAHFWIGDNPQALASTYTMSGGAINAGASVGIGAHTQATFDLSGDAAIILAGHLQIGDSPPGTGTLNMSGGTIALTQAGGGHVLLGHQGKGTINMSGGELTTPRFNIGQHGWNLSLPGWSTDPSLHSRGVMNQTGGLVNIDTALVIGEASGNDNQYNISGGTLRLRNPTTNNITAFIGSGQGRGALNVSGNAVVEIDSHIFAGSGSPRSVGNVNISGGTVELGKNIRFNFNNNNPNDPRNSLLSGGFLVAGEFGQAVVNVSGGNTKLDFIQLGRQNRNSGGATPPSATHTSQGQATQTGGTVTVGRSVAVGSSSVNNNFYEISGGTLDITGVVENPEPPPPPEGFTGDWPTAYRNAVNKNELQPGLHVARFSSNPTLGPVVYSNGRLTISGTATVNIAGGLYNSTGSVASGTALPGGTGLIEMKGGTLTAGSFLNGSLANPGTGASANYVQTGGTASVGHVTGSGQVSVSGGTMTVGSLRQSAATVGGTGTLQVSANGTDAGTSVVKTLSISDSGKLDLANNAMVIDYDTASGTPLAAVREHLKTGYAGGAWTGNGITSSTAAADVSTGKSTALGYGESGALFGTFPATFMGQTIDSDAVLIRYTFSGDSNLDGTVSFPDLVAVAQNYNTTDGSALWTDGDFNFDGNVTFPDLVMLAQNYNNSLPTAAAIPGASAAFHQDLTQAFASVPEPSLLAPLAVLAFSLTNRTRRHRK